MREYDNIYIFDDDKDICGMLHELGFRVFQVRLHPPLFSHAIDIISYSFHDELNLKLQNREDRVWQK